MSITVVYLLSRWKLAYTDFCLMQLLVTRSSSVYLLVRLIGDKVPGFDHVDLKML